MDKKIKRKIIITIIVTVVFIASLGITYAYFAATIGAGSQTDVNVTSKTTDNLYFTNGTAINLVADGVSFANGHGNLSGTTIPKATLIANNNTNSASQTYNAYFNITENNYEYSSTSGTTPELLLTVTKPDGTNLTTISGLDYVTSGGVSGFDITTKKGLIRVAEDYTITSTNTTTGVSQNWTFIVTFVNLNEDQRGNEGKTFTAYAMLQKEKEIEFGAFANQILANNGGATVIEAKGTPDFSKVAVSQAYYNTLTESTSPKQSQAVVENGMYVAPDDYGTSYYFRGAVDNNWVEFANMYWRIIRINGDGSVRMIYTGTTAPTEAQKVVMTGTGTQISESVFNSDSSTISMNDSFNSLNTGLQLMSNNIIAMPDPTSCFDNMYVGYMYTSGQVHGLGTPSTIKGVIDSWYETNLSSYENKLADNLFCNDRSAYTDTTGTTPGGGTGTTKTYYGAYIKNYTNKQPILTCPTKSDAFTATDTTKGNGALDYPIGLIIADEIAMAGGVYDRNNPNFYLNTNQPFWSFSPYYYRNGYASVFYLSLSGNMYAYTVDFTDDVRAVVSLKSDILTMGSGTWDDPYIVL